jgi:hypothetical protein
MEPCERKSTTLTPLAEAALVAFRVQTKLPLDGHMRTLLTAEHCIASRLVEDSESFALPIA